MTIDTSDPLLETPRLPQKVSFGLWVASMIATPLLISACGMRTFPVMTSLTVVCQLIATFLVVNISWPGNRILRSAVIIFGATWLLEYVGSRYGTVFGRYSYTLHLMPQAFGVPLLIPMAWVMMLFPAWCVSEYILSAYQTRLGKMYAIVYPAMSGLVFTVWDLYMDPLMVSQEFWLWEQPGAYYGIPWQNFIGWWLIAVLLTVILKPQNIRRPGLLMIYTITWLFLAMGIGIFLGLTGPALTGFVGMGIFALWAWRQYYRYPPQTT